MKGKKHIFSLFLAVSLCMATVFPMPVCQKVGAKENAKKTKYYTISKKAGTYTSAIKVKVKVKKGYRVYYKTSGKFKKSKGIKSGKSRTFRIEKTTVLSLCAVKKSEKVTNKKLNTTFRQKKKAYYAKYKYTISEKSAAESPSVTANETAAQVKLNETASPPAVSVNPSAAQTPSVMTDDTPVITLTAEGMTAENMEDAGAAYTTDGNVKTLTIREAGTYVLTGGSAADPVTNTEIVVAGDISDEVNLIWDSLVIDNSALGKNDGEDVPVFQVNPSTPNVHVTLKGNSVVTGNGAYAKSPAAAIICADTSGTVLTFSAYEGDGTASLTVVDGMDTGTDFGESDPSDGIYSKGSLVLDSGTYSIKTNGDCIKGTGKNGEGGIRINDGTYTLYSAHSNALKSKNGNIVISGGTIRSTFTADDSINAKNYEVDIAGGNLEIDQCYGDGIQGEQVNISGEDTVIDIRTYFENAGINYYDPSLGSGKYNTLTDTASTKTEVVNVDTGSHKGIKGGTKAQTYCYESVEDGSDYTAGTTYTTDASGGIVISGGTITVDTTNTGIKYNGSGNGGGAAPGGGIPSPRDMSAAGADGQYIIGSPDDGIHSNNTCVIEGGTLSISSSDDGITGPAGIMIRNGCDITIEKCYEGIEGGEIIIGSSEDSAAAPSVKIYSDDDGVNAASKSAVHYVYEDESEERYTKTETASNDNTLEVLDGYLNVMIGDDKTHTFSLSNADGTTTTGSYTSDGDGIDCNGSFYAYGGTIVIFGADSDGNSPIDTENGYCIGRGATLLAVGKSGMAESPSEKEQPFIVYSSSSGGFGGMRPGPGGNPGSSAALGADTAFAVMRDNDVLLAMKPVKNYNYVLYSSPELESGSAYTLYSGGSVSGSPVQAESGAFDYRYAEYDASGATVLSTVTAQN